MITEERFLDLFAHMQARLISHMEEQFHALDEKWETRFQSMQEEMRAGLHQVNVRLDLHEQRLAKIEQHMEQRFTAMEQRIIAMEQQVTNLEQRFTAMEQQMTTMEQRLVNLELGEEKILAFIQERSEKNLQLLDERFQQVYDTIRQSEEDQETHFNQVLRVMNQKRR
ncbi:hypothetical protein CIG75_12555 [Tumebacillus algifaecis]|uniref:Uncharacterized protein n=1 Tax=Tumebacillus algifaecis TaxID=1214604 RepID=A0A223D2I0_9BACL|nr:hypothetical protein [Tumebacillus algifaecis]ASS75731.1 hypothetical protein CIG75_12555 [Tumebacillus algifaecis]